MSYRPVKSKTNVNVLLGVNVPQKRVSNFVDRAEILEETDEWLLNESEETSVVLLGMGGSGKTQLALECCRRAESNSSFTAVLWIDASSPMTVAQSYSAIALKVTGGSQSVFGIEESMAIVEGALQQQKGRWLAVLDNFDDPRSFEKHGLRHYVPKAKNGGVLFTSRNASSERLGHVIRVSGMSEDESSDLLLQRPVSDAAERVQGLEVAAVLGHLALALDQAGAYIRAPSLPLQDFRSHYRNRKKVILEEMPDQWEYRRKLGETEKETVLNVFVTWELSFEQIDGGDGDRDGKEHFFTLAAYSNNNCISQRYFEPYCRSDKPEWMQIFATEGEWDEYRLGDVVAECRKLSLVQMSRSRAGEVQFSLHPVVSDWLRVRRNREEQRLYGREFTALLTGYIEGVEFDELDLEVKQETISHIDACARNDRETLRELYGPAMECRSYSASVFASCYRSNGGYDEAEELYERALAGREEKLGPKHPDTLQTVRNFAVFLEDRGRVDEAHLLSTKYAVTSGF